MSMGVRGRGAAEFEAVQLSHGRPGLGFYQLNFRVLLKFWAANTETEALTLDIEGGDVSVSRPRTPGPVLLGRLHRESGIPRTMMTGAHRPQFTWDLSVDIAPERLEALEALRAGGDLEFHVRLFGRASDRDGNFESSEEGTVVRVNQSEWASVLAKIGYRNTLLLEVAVLPSEAHADLAAAVARLQEARDEFQRGQYKRAVESCRHVLEALGHELGDGVGTTALLRPTPDRQVEMTKDDRLMWIRRASYVMACLAAHSKDNVSIRTTWDRHDALGLITVVAGLVHWIAGNRRASD